MKFKLCALLSAVTFAVTACGGSGDDNTVQVNQPTKPVANNEQPFEMKEQMVVWKGAYHNQMVKLTINDSPTTLAGQDSNNDTALSKITVDGKDLLFKPFMKTFTRDNGSKWNYIESYVDGNPYAYAIVYGADTAYARYGLLNFQTVSNSNTSGFTDGDYILFYQGNPTSLDDIKELEKNANNVTYTGQAQVLKQGTIRGREVIHPVIDHFGTTQFTVNFQDKTLKGTIDKWDLGYYGDFTLKPVTIDAKIQANTFSGTANKTGTVEGKFYGPNAANLAGSFNDKSQKLRGVFGAVKQ